MCTSCESFSETGQQDIISPSILMEIFMINTKKFIEINDVVVAKKKSLYRIVVQMSLGLFSLEKTYNQFEQSEIYKKKN